MNSQCLLTTRISKHLKIQFDGLFMAKICLGNQKIRSFHIYSQRYKNTPFDLDLDTNENNGEFQELNSMYNDMFTIKSPDLRRGENNSKDSKNTNNIMDEISELNDEMDELCQPFDTSSIKNLPRLGGDELKQLVEDKGRFIISSLSHNPFYNLSLEDYLFRNSGNSHVSNKMSNDFFQNNERLLFYINDKCAVIGKNQTIWKELYLQNLYKNGYQVLRRLSGGGTVIHDLGNVNYSYLTSRQDFKREFFNECIVKWMLTEDPKLNLVLNERGDITLNGLKVSGSAFKIARGKSYHHGTMLINSEIDKFKGLLKPDNIPNIEWKCNSVDSVRSKITNLSFLSPQNFIDICVNGFREHFDDQDIKVYFCDEQGTMNNEIRSKMDELMSYEWKFTSGPPFELNTTIEGKAYRVKVDKGKIIESNIPNITGMSFQEFTQLSKAMFGIDL